AGRIVGDRVDQQRDAARAVALVRHFGVADALELTRPLLDCPLDVFFRHRAGARRVDRKTEPRVSTRIAAAELRGHRDFTNELREESTTFGVSRRLVVLDLLPFTVTGHSQNIRWRWLGGHPLDVMPRLEASDSEGIGGQGSGAK